MTLFFLISDKMPVERFQRQTVQCERRGLHRKEGERLKSISRRVSSCREIEKKPEDRPERGDTKGITGEESLNNFQTDYSLELGGGQTQRFSRAFEENLK